MTPIDPFEFRFPVRDGRRLVGREREMAMLEGVFAATAEGIGRHVLIEGPPRRGKTSILNAASGAATEAGLLPARLDVSTVLFDSDVGFFRALLDSVVVSLAPLCRIQATAERYASLMVGQTDETLPELGFPLFSTFETESLSPPLLRADLGRAVEAAKLVDRKGIVFFVDDAHFLFEQAEHAVIEALDALLRANTSWSMVLAGDLGTSRLMREHSFGLQQRFKPLQVRRLGFEAVRELFASRAPQLASRLGLTTAFDLWLLSGLGEPYWLNVGAHLIREAAGDEEECEITPSLIKTLTRLQQKSAHNPEEMEAAINKMDAIDKMRDELVESASRLAPYEAMTLPEYVLAQRSARLAEGETLDSDFDAALATTETTMGELVTEGLIEKNEDRFHVEGHNNVQVYLRYEAARRTGQSPVSAFGHTSYGTAAAPSWLERLARELEEVEDELPVATFMETFSPSGSEAESAGDTFTKLQEGVDQRNPVQIAEAGFYPSYVAVPDGQEELARTRGLSYVGIVFAVGVDSGFSFELERVACGWLRWNTGEGSDFDCKTAVQQWLADHAEEISEYRLRPVQVVAGTIDRDITDQTVALMAPLSVPGIVVALYREKKLSGAGDYLTRVVRAFERGLEGDALWSYQWALIDAYTRLGFITALLGRQDDSWSALKRAEALQADVEAGRAADRYLVVYNLAHVRGMRGEFAAAAEGTSLAADMAETSDSGAFLLLYLPVPPTWSAPDATWNTAAVESADVSGTMFAQARCFEALAGKYDKSEFEEAVGDLSRFKTAALRVLGWTWFTRFNAPQQARIAFDAAVDRAEEGKATLVAMERDFISAGDSS